MVRVLWLQTVLVLRSVSVQKSRIAQAPSANSVETMARLMKTDVVWKQNLVG